jgi:hypothetical protein
LPVRAGCAAHWSVWLPTGWRSRALRLAPGRTAVPRTPGPPARSPAASSTSRRPRSGTGRSCPRYAAWPKRPVRPGQAPGRCRPGAAAHPARTRSERQRIRCRPTPPRRREPAGAGTPAAQRQTRPLRPHQPRGSPPVAANRHRRTLDRPAPAAARHPAGMPRDARRQPPGGTAGRNGPAGRQGQNQSKPYPHCAVGRRETLLARSDSWAFAHCT